MPNSVEVVVLGAGPAGATAARLLALWGYSVLLLDSPKPHQALAESVPPGIHGLIEQTGADMAEMTAGCTPNTGNTSWWGGADPAVLRFPVPGYHLDRGQFDGWLHEKARAAGATILRNTRAPRFDLSSGTVEHDHGGTAARFLIDASGRAGLIARQIRRLWDDRHRTTALCAAFRTSSTWNVDPNHSLMEAHATGWAWSVPFDPARRSVGFMVDSAAVRGGTEAAFDRALRATTIFSRLFESCELEGDPWAGDVSVFHSERYAGRNWLLIGDAASAVAPLCSYGVEKAMQSAWTGAVAVNTCLANPAMAETALAFFNAEEARTFANHARTALLDSIEGESMFNSVFWTQRAKPPEELEPEAEALSAVYRALRNAATVRFTLRRPPVEEALPAIQGREVVLARRSVLPGLENTEHMHGINLAALAAMAPAFTADSRSCAAYESRFPGTPAGHVRAALCLLVARGVLEMD